MAPEEALGEILQVPLGCVTPFALVNESARHVSLLLDQGFKSQEHCFFHPLSNDMTISLNASDLDKFFKSIGRDPAYVDLEANHSVGKDQPPDLASFVPSGSTAVPDPTENLTSSKGPSENSTASTDIKSKKVAVNASKPTSTPKNSKDKPVQGVNSYGSTTNVERFVEEILEKTSALLLSQITEETIKQHGAQLGTVLSNSIKSRLSSELNNTTMTFKNATYTEGFHAGIHHHSKPAY